MSLGENKLVTAFLGLGANLGDPIQQIVDARRCLLCLSGTEALRSSSLYVSSPVGYSEQPNFINCVVALETHDDAHILLDDMQSIEKRLGRVRDASNQNAPRMIDIDLLLYGETQINDPRLIVPHPRMQERLFVLEPLHELGVRDYPKSLNTDFTQQELHKLSL